MSLIVAENIVKKYGHGDAAVSALSGVSFQIEPGEFVAAMGESGAGKSTMLSVLGAMTAPTMGRLTVDEIDVYSLGQEQRSDFRREFIGFIFQSFQLIQYLTVLENVMIPLAIIKISKKEKISMAKEVLSQVGLVDKADRLPGMISGGEKERVAIARAIVNEPPLLLADEPTGNLDTKTSCEIMELLKRLNSEGMTIIMVTHSPLSAGYAHRRLNLSDGLLVNSNNIETRKNVEEVF